MTLNFEDMTDSSHLQQSIPDIGAVVFRAGEWSAENCASAGAFRGTKNIDDLPKGIYITNLPFNELKHFTPPKGVHLKFMRWMRITLNNVSREWRFNHDVEMEEGRDRLAAVIARLMDRNVKLLSELCNLPPAAGKINFERSLETATGGATIIRNIISDQHDFARERTQYDLVRSMSGNGLKWERPNGKTSTELGFHFPRFDYAEGLFANGEPHGTGWKSARLAPGSGPDVIHDWLNKDPGNLVSLITVQIPPNNFCDPEYVDLIEGYISSIGMSDRRLHLTSHEFMWMSGLCKMTVLTVDRPQRIRKSMCMQMLNVLENTIGPGGLSRMTWSCGVLAEMISSAAIQVREIQDGQKSIQSSWFAALDRGMMSSVLPYLVKLNVNKIYGYCGNIQAYCDDDPKTIQDIVTNAWSMGLIPDSTTVLKAFPDKAPTEIRKILSEESFPYDVSTTLNATSMTSLLQLGWDLDGLLDLPQAGRIPGFENLQKKLKRANDPKH